MHIHQRAAARTGKAATAAVAVVCTVGLAIPASGAPLDRGQIHDVGNEDGVWCDEPDVEGDAINVNDAWDVSGSFTIVSQGRDGLPHYRESLRGTEVVTNLDTGLTFRQTWVSSGHDVKVTDNGDGTSAVLVLATNNSFWTTETGLSFHDAGSGMFLLLVDNGGTPTDPSDDEGIDLIRTVRYFSGRLGTAGRDFCADLREFTS